MSKIKMALKPYSEAFYNTLEHLDRNPTTGEGVTLDNARAGIDSSFIHQAYEEGYIEHYPAGSAKYKITVAGIDLLNQMRLKNAIEKANAAANRSAWINAILTLVIAAATIYVTIKFS
jgi:hypothetical protein